MYIIYVTVEDACCPLKITLFAPSLPDPDPEVSLAQLSGNRLDWARSMYKHNHAARDESGETE